MNENRPHSVRLFGFVTRIGEGWWLVGAVPVGFRGWERGCSQSTPVPLRPNVRPIEREPVDAMPASLFLHPWGSASCKRFSICPCRTGGTSNDHSLHAGRRSDWGGATDSHMPLSAVGEGPCGETTRHRPAFTIYDQSSPRRHERPHDRFPVFFSPVRGDRYAPSGTATCRHAGDGGVARLGFDHEWPVGLIGRRAIWGT